MKILLIDGNSVLFRAFYATNFSSLMQTTSGIYINAVFGFANMLNKALKIIKPDYCCVAFDKGKATFRHQMCIDYKAGRKETPVELVDQFSLVRSMLNAYNIKYLEYDDLEADDIIGILANKFKGEVAIFSSDHDLFQLIDDAKKIKIYCMKKGMSDIGVLDEKTLYEQYHLRPKQIIDFKGLAGDKSDNIKGVGGIGEKTAIKLLNEYDSCEGIYKHIDEIKGKLKEKLVNDEASCFESKKLATIITDYDLNINLDDLKLNIDENGINAFFSKYEMYSLINKQYIDRNINNIKGHKVTKISAYMYNNPFIYILSDEFSYYERSLYGIVFALKEHYEYIDLNDLKKDPEALAFLASDQTKCVFGLKDIKHNLEYHGLSIGKNTDDLFLMCFLINNNHDNLTKICHYYGHSLNKHLKDIFGTVKKPIIPFNEVDALNYSFEVVSYLIDIYPKAINKLKEYELYDYYKNIELKLSYVLYEMEKEGIYCDAQELDKIATATYKKIESLQDDIYALANMKFNINSPLQLKEVIYHKLNLPNFKKDSTDADVLNKLIDYHPIIAKILEYRKYSKLNSTYAEGLKKYIKKDGKIHTIFSQTSTATGRLSSSEPNMQNISIRDEELRTIRKAFKAKEDSYILSCDYSQIELRVLASLAHEQKMIDAFNKGIDIHTMTAMDVFHLKKEEVTPLIRRHAKAVNFGVVYGISEYGLANQTSLSYQDASKYIENYFDNYPNIKKFMDNEIKFCEEHGYVLTMLKRRRYIDEIKSNKWALREFGKRAAMNSPIQGSAADLIKIAMIKMADIIKEKKLKSKLVLQVHDELIFDVPKQEIELMLKLVKDTMINAYKLDVDLDVSINYASNWYEVK